MAEIKGNYRKGWKIYFTESESEDIADSISAGSIAATLIPEPTVSKIVAVLGGVLALAARRAIKKGKKLGVTVKLHQLPQSWPPTREELFVILMRGPLGPSLEPFTH